MGLDASTFLPRLPSALDSLPPQAPVRLPRLGHLRMRTKIRLLTTSRMGWICPWKRLNPPQHAPLHRSISFNVYRPGGHPGWPPRMAPDGPSARHACLALVTPSAHRRIVPCSRAAWCSACAPGRSQPCHSSQSPLVGRSVGDPTDARIAGKRPGPTRSGTRVAVVPSVRGGARRDA